jgi:hypothetical protein
MVLAAAEEATAEFGKAFIKDGAGSPGVGYLQSAYLPSD